MTRIIKLRKGLDINLKGKADKIRVKTEVGKEYALCPNSFPGIKPKVVVKEGDHVKVGEILFVNKYFPTVGFSSPVSGNVASIVRGERRKVLQVIIEVDDIQQYVDFGPKDIDALSSEEIIKSLLDAGLFGYINQLPYAVSTNPDILPKGIFISALRDKPLACDFEYELIGNEKDFQTGLTVLSKISKTYLGIGRNQCSEILRRAKDVEVNIFDGPCPAGNVGVQVNHIDPVNKGDVAWTVDPTTVIYIGRLFNTGKVNLQHTIAIAGSEVHEPCYADVLVGQKIDTLLKDKISSDKHVRIINGNVLTGQKCTLNDYLDAHASELTVIPEGDDTNELFGWIMPRLKQYSVSKSYFSWLTKNKEYTLDSRIKGGRRNMIMSGEYDKVLPMDIFGEYLIKSIIVGDIDKMEALGIYEVSPEDFALPEFVDSSKLELQSIVRKGLDMLRKENA
ncbi:Na(+)-translocating NADH-quinone reductase subunit A [uncultured Prevotella sp.]|uniref:Na(+)-translocating NADH-quinone reductase subunit A n=1 Tax=uncultured Prevotella sp. TaxID=159272 RepID=UPI0026392353|nr:Na(+)-translocating NADH-quinone reductase subunit A [uncultured Prevotella sp.]